MADVEQNDKNDDKCYFVTRTPVTTYVLDWKIEQFLLNANVLGRTGNLVSPIFPTKPMVSGDGEQVLVKLQVSLSYKQLESPSCWVLGVKMLRADEQDEQDGPIYNAEARLCFVDARNKEVDEQYCYFVVGLQNYTPMELPHNMREILADGALTLRCEVKLAKQKSNMHVHLCELRETFKQQAMHQLENSNDIYEGLGVIDKNHSFSDVELLIEDQVFKVHKVVLASRSSKFTKIFNTKPDVTQHEIHDLKASNFEVMKKFMYENVLEDFDSLKTASDILIDASEYGVNELKRLCETYIYDQLCNANSFDILTLADRCCCDEFKKTILRFICREFKRGVLDTEDYKHLKRTNPQLAVELLEQLNVPDE
ncbi:speckle-type POZ protein-like [Trichogramma pretiosum]|uniref:speckle-type POZ protein-like n=1 Tax=Trichogramma pretiosum TaxID=7493 RepID=UPI0006C98118|nr:speckle-type POZ protein-like [Trichogramma pretiosum]